MLDFSVSRSERGINRIWVAIDHTFRDIGHAVSTSTTSGEDDQVTEINIAADIRSPADSLRLLEWDGGDKVNIR